MEWKLSYYTVFTDPVDEQGRRILFCSRTAKAVLITDICYQLLIHSIFSELPKATLELLSGMKALVPAGENELHAIVQENSDYLDNESQRSLYEVIQPTANCQLGCYYCGQHHSKHAIAQTLYEKLVSRIKRKLDEHPYEQLSIGWFGGEPLLGIRQMRELTAQFKALAREYKVRYNSKVVTNGLALKKKVFDELVKDMNVVKIEITLDGDKEYHDKHRYTKKGQESFDVIFNNLKEILNDPDYSQQHCSISIRCNVDSSNVEGVSKLITRMAEEGMHQKIAYFYPIGIYSWGGNEAHKKSLTKESFAKREIDWIIEMIRLGYRFDAKKMTPKRKKLVCMTVLKNSDVYDAYGNIFSCTEVSYSDIYKDTYLFSGKLTDQLPDTAARPLLKWNETVKAGKFQCQKCRIFPVCGGSCPKSWEEGIPACPSMKFNLKERLMVGYVLGHFKPAEVPEKLDQIRATWEAKEFAAV